MRIVFFGEDSFSNVVLESLIRKGLEIILVVSPLYQNLIHKRLENTCKQNSIEYMRVLNFDDDVFICKLRRSCVDLIVIAHFEKLLKKSIIDIPKYGSINLHPSLLPKYRGMSPQHWPIINGESETGVTVHYIDENADTGDIIIQKKINIYPWYYVSDLQLEFLKIYKYIVCEAIDLIQKSNFSPKKQVNKNSSYYGKLKKHQCELSTSLNCHQALCLIRGVSKPYFGAFLNNMIIWKAHFASEHELFKINNQSKMGLNLSTEMGYFLRLSDGILIIEKYEIKE